MQRFVSIDGPAITSTPLSGAIFGRPVADLVEWAEVAANSEAFAQQVAREFWRYFIGEEPGARDAAEFERIWRRLIDEHDYRVEAMIADLITTEAYGVP